MTDMGHDVLDVDASTPTASRHPVPARPRKLTNASLPRMAALASAEFVLLTLAFVMAVSVRFGADLAFDTREMLLRAPVFPLVILAAMASMGLYTLRHRAQYAAVAARVLVGVTLAVGGLGVATYLIPSLHMSPGVLGIATLLALPALLVSRFAALRLMDDDSLKRRVLILGSGESAGVIAARLRRRSDQRSFRIVGYVPWTRDVTVVSPEQLVRAQHDLANYVMRERIDQVVVALDDRRGGMPQEILRTLRLRGVTISDPVTFLEREAGYISVDLASPSWLIFSEGFPNDLLRAGTKRLFDVLVASTLLVLALPIALVAAILVKLEDGGPILYRQVRAGAGGRPFKMLKFRSMGVAAEERPPRDAHRGVHPQDPHRRAPASRQRAAGRHELRGPAPRAPGVRRPAVPEHPVLPRAPLREARHHRLGTGLLPLRVDREGRAREAGLRPLLREEPQPADGPDDPARDGRDHRLPRRFALRVTRLRSPPPERRGLFFPYASGPSAPAWRNASASAAP